MFQQMLNWSHDYGAHHVDVLLDHENYAYSYEENYIRKSGQQLDGLIHMGNFAEMKDMTVPTTPNINLSLISVAPATTTNRNTSSSTPSDETELLALIRITVGALSGAQAQAGQSPKRSLCKT